MIFMRLSAAMIAAAICGYAGAGQPPKPPAAVDSSKMRDAERQGTELGDTLVNTQRSPSWYGTDGSGAVVINNEWVRVDSLVPSTDGQDYVQKLKSHADDKNIDGLRQLTEEEGDRLSKTTAGNGQAATVLNNTAAKFPIQRRNYEQDQVLKDSSPILRGAATGNLVLGQVFADCNTTTETVVTNSSGPLDGPQACSYVELNQRPGYRGTIERKVSVQQDYQYQSTNDFITVAPGTTLTMSGTISGVPADASFDYITNFTAFVSPQIIRPFYTVTVTKIPDQSNGWSYSVDVLHQSSDTNSGQILFVVAYNEKSDPVFTFTPTCIDGDCSAQGDEFCKAEWTCSETAPVQVAGYTITQDMVRQEPPLYVVDPLDDPTGVLRDTARICMKASLAINCSRIYSGNACWPADPGSPGSGNCVPAPDNGLPNSCPAFENDPSCAQVGSGCAVGGRSEISGFCYIKTKLFSCGQPIGIPDQIVRTKTECAGYQSCMEGNCLADSKNHEYGYSRTQAAAQQVIVQHVGADWTKPKPAQTLSPEAKAAAEEAEVKAFLERAKVYEATHPENQ